MSIKSRKLTQKKSKDDEKNNDDKKWFTSKAWKINSTPIQMRLTLQVPYQPASLTAVEMYLSVIIRLMQFCKPEGFQICVNFI